MPHENNRIYNSKNNYNDKINFNPYSTNSSINLQAGPNKSPIPNVFHENLLYCPKVFEDDDEVKRNITEQIKSVIFYIIFIYF